ncbi:hypothetical protein JVU11DRAFT_12127 [Chiua virens]|nr:hypothetical protein JVU11DRAFT_12127 [Chiua virens]
MLKGAPTASRTVTEPRRIHIKNHPELELFQLDLPTAPTRTLFTEETTHYPVEGPLADLEWESLLPNGLHSVVLMGPDSNPRPYAVAMFHTLHCLDRIRRSILQPAEDIQGRYHVHHCFNYVRQMVLCAANTRLNPATVHPSGALSIDGIGLTYECRDWNKVYELYDANTALNRTMSFA